MNFIAALDLTISTGGRAGSGDAGAGPEQAFGTWHALLLADLGSILRLWVTASARHGGKEAAQTGVALGVSE